MVIGHGQRHGQKTEEGKRKFPIFSGMTEHSARLATIAMTVVLSSFGINCGGNPPTSDGNGGGDSGMVSDGGVHAEAGVDASGPGLCATYGEGDSHRKVFHLSNVGDIPGSVYKLEFLRTGVEGTERSSAFMYCASLSGAQEFIGFAPGDVRTKDVPDVGPTTFELCASTSNACSWNGTMMSGDVNCTATLASSRGW